MKKIIQITLCLILCPNIVKADDKTDANYFNAVKYYESGEFVKAFEYIKNSLDEYSIGSSKRTSALLVYSYILTKLGNENEGTEIFLEYIEEKLIEDPTKALMFLDNFFNHHHRNKNIDYLNSAIDKFEHMNYTGFNKAYYEFLKAKVFSLEDHLVTDKINYFHKVAKLPDPTGLIQGLCSYNLGLLHESDINKIEYFKSAISLINISNINLIKNKPLSKSMTRVKQAYIFFANHELLNFDNEVTEEKLEIQRENASLINLSWYYYKFNLLSYKYNIKPFDIIRASSGI